MPRTQEHTLTLTATGTTPDAMTLTDAERAEMIAVATDVLTATPALIDDPAWLDTVRDASAMLPRTVLAALRRFRHDAGPDGVLLLRNMPVVANDPLPETPTVPGSVERVPAVASALVTAAMLQLGEVIAYRSEKTGALVQNVVPVPGSESSQSNAGSVLLELHVENAFHDNKPDYVGLLCVREDPTGDAKLCTSSVRRALPLLSERTVAVLAAPRFLTEPPPSFGDLNSVTPAHPVLVGDPQDPNILVDFAATHPLDDEAKAAMGELREALMRTMSALALRVGDLAVVDNRLAVHGRTSFTPRYDGQDRWLHRVYAHLDHRRSRVDRKGGGAVLN
ncbi:TauD/TfdA family dioxygenase [Streptomyces sp. NBC_00249]|uniref:TauD/TfdA family dioxygenase n=1 Tax=Streptomyces sp. NBC_00249 TaxID=2975690 RepID=UPI00224E747C|nr:TauD/TfdA family dioxygenase [Streptomyces sp. NBC_00249]MCX5193827.1 TauD/TfdA family dioxygenase [Streptomyces sp. NBC_00249]